MNLFDLEGKLCKIDVRQSSYPIRQLSKSKLQEEVGEYLVNKYPRDVILEEFKLPNSRLSVDFFIPNRMLVIEVQGKQHQEFNPFFHGNQETSNKFVKQIVHDHTKQKWCDINNIKYIEIFSSKQIYERIQ